MSGVQLTRDGSLIREDGVTVVDVLPVFGSTFSFAAGCTLRSFLSMASCYPVLLSVSEFLPACLTEAKECPSTGCVHDEISVLVMGKTMELIGFPGKPRAELYLWMRGLVTVSAESFAVHVADPNGCMPLTALMTADRETRFIPLRMLLDIPLCMGGLKHVVLGDVNRNLFCESGFTLFEVVDGLAWEFGFRGGSQQCSLGR